MKAPSEYFKALFFFLLKIHRRQECRPHESPFLKGRGLKFSCSLRHEPTALKSSCALDEVLRPWHENHTQTLACELFRLPLLIIHEMCRNTVQRTFEQSSLMPVNKS